MRERSLPRSHTMYLPVWRATATFRGYHSCPSSLPKHTVRVFKTEFKIGSPTERKRRGKTSHSEIRSLSNYTTNGIYKKMLKLIVSHFPINKSNMTLSGASAYLVCQTGICVLRSCQRSRCGGSSYQQQQCHRPCPGRSRVAN
jgi:hypothetical protein